MSSTRVFNLSFQGARTRMKVVASDLGRYEQESWVDNVVIAPAERFVVDVRFERGRRGVAGQPRARDRSHPGAVLRRDADARRRARRRRAGPRPITRRRSSGCAATPRSSRKSIATAPQFDRAGRPRADHHAGDRRAAVSAPAADEFRVGLSASGRVERHDAGDGLGGDRPRGAMDPARARDGAREHGHPAGASASATSSSCGW